MNWNVPMLLLFFMMYAAFCTAQSPKPCADKPEYRQFDFWVGEWDVEANGKKAGVNSIQKILDGCVIFENWTGVSGYTGKSFNLYNAVSKKWEQIWVDNQGGILKLEGEVKNGEMHYTGVTPQADGTQLMEKLTFFPLEGGRIRQLWEQSKDSGKTWTTVFDGHYTKK